MGKTWLGLQVAAGLLDGCEHVIGACAKLADALLRGCPNPALLAISRNRWASMGSGYTGCRRWASGRR